MNTLKERIEYVLAHTGWSRARLANEAGVSRSAPTEWLKGKSSSMSAKTAAKLEANSPFNAVWLSTGEGDRFKKTVPDTQTDGARFDVLDVRAACGEGAVNPDRPETIRQIIMPVDEAMKQIGSANRNNNVKVIVAIKDSMTPTINPNDLLFVDMSVKEYRGEAIYILLHGGELLCKRIQLVGKDLVVISDNKAYEPWKWQDRPEETQIVGKVLRALPMNFRILGN